MNQTIEQNPKNFEEMTFKNIEQDLHKWSIPKMNPTKVYNKGILAFRQICIIKTLEKSISISNNIESIKLLTNQVIEELHQEYKYIHLGLIQVAIKL